MKELERQEGRYRTMDFYGKSWRENFERKEWRGCEEMMESGGGGEGDDWYGITVETSWREYVGREKERRPKIRHIAAEETKSCRNKIFGKWKEKRLGEMK